MEADRAQIAKLEAETKALRLETTELRTKVFPAPQQAEIRHLIPAQCKPECNISCAANAQHVLTCCTIEKSSQLLLHMPRIACVGPEHHTIYHLSAFYRALTDLPSEPNTCRVNTWQHLLD